MGSGGLHIEIEAFFNIIGLKNVEFYLNGKHFTWGSGVLPLEAETFFTHKCLDNQFKTFQP